MRSRLIFANGPHRSSQICGKYDLDCSQVKKGDYLFELDQLNLEEKASINEISTKFPLLSILKKEKQSIVLKINPEKSLLESLENTKSDCRKIDAFIHQLIKFFKFEKKSWQLGQNTLDFQNAPIIMGILNVTSDSFSDGGSFLEKEKAIERALVMVEEGAQIIDIGGESTRPGADKVSESDELARVMPVIEGLKKHSNTIVSIDTYKSVVAKNALQAGAHIINDISGTVFDENMTQVVADFNCPVVVMHIKGTPKTMQQNTDYDDVVSEVYHFLNQKCEVLRKLNNGKIIVDPGFGFGKSVKQNLELLRDIFDFTFLDMPLLVGISRKSFIGHVLDVDVEQRITGSLAAAMYAAQSGADILRVHDVKETIQAKTMLNQILAV